MKPGLLLLISLMLIPTHAIAAETSGATRVLFGKVLRPNGSPAPNATVYILQAARPSYNYFITFGEAQRTPAYQAKTNSLGEYKIEFVVTGQGDMRGQDTALGHGVYYFVVAPTPADAGALGGPIINPDRTNQEIEFWKSEFKDAKLALSDKPLELNLQIREGDMLTGMVEDQNGKPLPNVKIEINSEVPFNSHTGEGGEFFERSALTGGDGQFKFDHVLPGQLEIAFQADKLVWTHTKLGKDAQWRNEPVDTVDSGAWIGIRAVPQSTLIVSGRVTDEAGRPVPGAEVSVSRTRVKHPVGRDIRPSSTVRTDEQGKYSIQLGTQWFADLTVQKQGYETHVMTLKDEAFPIGEYNVKLKPSQK